MEWEVRPAVVMKPPEQQEFSMDGWIRVLLSQEEALTSRLDAANRLAEMNDPQSVHALLSIIQQETEARLLIHVIGLLARKKIYSAVMPLIDLVLGTGDFWEAKPQKDFLRSDTGIRVRTSAIQALGRMGDDRAIVPLMSILGDMSENYRIRLSAAESLGRLGDAQALNPLISIVKDDHETSQYLKESAVKALGMLGDIRALEPLLDIFESKRGIKSKFSFLKEQIIEAIGRLGARHNRAQEALLEALEDEAPCIRLSAVESLKEIGDASCIPEVKKRLMDSDDDVALAAISTLYHLGGESLIRDILAEQENLPQFIRQEMESYVP